MDWRRIALIVFCVGALSTSADHQVKIKPFAVQYTKPLGSSMLLTCEAVGLDATAARTVRLQWLGMDGKEISDSSGRIYVETDGPSVKKLYITDIQDGDNGTYTCSSSISGGTETKTVTLQLFKDITFDLAPSPQHPTVHTDGVVMCSVSGNPKPEISWRHKGRRILSDNRYTLEEGALRIKNITENDDGIYSCRAEVDAEGRYDERKITVVVYIPPVITSFQERVEGIEGHEAAIACEATGIPKPKFEFYDSDEQRIMNSSRFHIDSEAGSLHIYSVKKEDGGAYICQAINEVGRASQEVELKILSAPFIYELKNETVTEGDTISIDCLSSGEPAPVMLFFRGRDSKEIGAEHNESGRISIRKSPGHETLVIRDVVPSDAAIYTCTSTNTAGHHERISQLTVNYKPRFPPGLPTLIHSWEGRIQNISCNATSHPAPSIEWLHNDQGLTSNVTYHIYEVTPGISLLEVRTDETSRDWIYGNYTCRAKNQFGEVDHQMELIEATVPDPPEARINERSTNHLVIVVIPNSDGGMRVTGYSVQYGTMVQDFPRLTTQDDAAPMPLVVDNLTSNKTYIFRIYARNDVGTSRPTELLATTDEVSVAEPPPAAAVASIGTNIVIAIIIGIFVLFLIIVDVSCYFINGCGLTMCVCVQLCGRTKPKATPNEMEEGESKEILKETPPDMEADEAKSSQEDLEEEKQHLAEAHDVESLQVEEVEELIERPQPLMEEPPQPPIPAERRNPPNRKSILSYGDGRWKDVVHELETQLGVKKTRSDDEYSDDQTKRDYDDELELHT